jgi:biopolymer transport protein ExbD
MSSPSHAAEPQLNATPLIDVLLVLLIMLIFTIPVATHNVTLTLPHVPPISGKPPERLVVGIDFDGLITLNGQRVESVDGLEARLRAAQAQVPGPEVHIDPDARGRYEIVAQVLAAAQRAHVTKLSVAQIPDRG